MRQKQKIKNTTILIFALAAFLAGLGFARISPDQGFQSGIIILPIVAGIFVIRKKLPLVFALTTILLSFVLGWWRGAQYMQKLKAYDDIIGHNVVMEVVANEDAVYSERGQLTFTAGNLVLLPAKTAVVGQISIEGRGVPMVYRGDKLRVEGKAFRRRGANQAGLSFAQMTLVSHNTSYIDVLRRKFAAGMQNSLPEPLASFGLGLLIGQRNTLSQSITNELTSVGLIHIVAVSGYNLTIIIGMGQRLFSERSRYQTMIISLALIVTFLLFTGYSPSILRAAVVSSIGLVMWYFGRKVRPLLLLLLAAVLTAGVNPLMIWSNVGWYLSFSAFFGVLIVAPLINARIIGDKSTNLILPVLGETVSAQLCTLPIILFIFGRLSIISIVANLLVVPLVPVAMLASLVAGVAGMLGAFIGGIVGLPARVLLRYMLDVSRLLSKIPHSNIEVHVTAWQMLYLYALIVFVIIILLRKQNRKTPTRS